MMKFSEWLPDQPAFENAGATEAKNVIPAVRGYRALKDLGAISGAATGDILGMTAGKADDGDVAIYCGDSTKLYEFTAATSALTDRSKSGNYSNGSKDRWNFVQFGETLIAPNYADPPQATTVDSGAAFADLGGTPPKAKFVAVVRDQVMFANTNDGVDGVKPYRVWWSGINSATSWTSGTALSDYQDMPDLGDCTGLVGGEYAIALFERGIVRGGFVGAPLVYQFDKIVTSRGCSVPGSVASIGNTVFFLSDDGFYMLSGSELQAIGAEKVNQFFYDRVNLSAQENIVAAVDPLNQAVVWAYPSFNSGGTKNDELLIYNYNLNRWSRAVVSCDALAQLFTVGYTLEELDNVNSSLDALPASLDSPLFLGDSFFFAAAADKKIQSFTGDRLPAVIDTGEFQIGKNRSLVNTVVPYVSGETPTVTAQVGSRALPYDDVTFSTEASTTSEGFIPVRSEGRYHRVRLNITGVWDQAQGLDVDARATGMR